MLRPTETSPEAPVNDNTRALKRQLNWDLMSVGLIVVILIARFFKTIFAGKSLSDIYLTAHWDSLFYSLRSGLNFPMDSSLVLQFAPQTFFVAALWRQGLPLWNRFSGLGMPLLADPQTFVLSPLCLPFFLFPSMYVWNLSIVLKLALGAVSTYYLSRQLNANVLGSLSAALVYTFCPWIQFETEMFGNGLCLAPLVIFTFIRAAKQKSLWAAVLAGVAVAVDLLSAHPEIAFVTVVFGCLALLFVDLERNGKQFNWLSNIAKIATAAVVSFGLSAPMLIPFAELLMNGETYKFSAIGMSDISLSALIAVLIFPFYKFGSVYAGPLSWIALPAIFLAPWRNRGILFGTPVACLLLSALSVTKSFPLNGLFLVPPFREVNSIYCLPVYALFLSVVSGLGAQALFELAKPDLGDQSNRTNLFKTLSFIVGVAFLAAGPAIFHLWQQNAFVIDFGFMQEIPTFSRKWWWLEFLPIVSLLTLRKRAASTNRFKHLLAPVLVLLTSAAGLLIISADSLPIRPSFAYPKSVPAPLLDRDSPRSISVGTHVFRPATNLVYQIPMLTMWNPVFPRGFGSFIESSGAIHTEANTHTFNAGIRRFLDLASVKTIFSNQPLLDEVEADRMSALAKRKYAVNNILFSKDLVLSNLQLFVNHQSNTVFCRCTAYPLKSQSTALCFEIKDAQGKVLSALESQPIWMGKMGQTVICSGSLPLSTNPAHFSLRVINDAGKNLPATFSSEGKISSDGSVDIGSLGDEALVITVTNHRLKLKAHAGDLSVYSNESARNSAFFASRVHFCNSQEEAMDWLNQHDPDIANTVVLENRQLEDFKTLFKQASGGRQYLPDQTFDRAGTVSLETERSSRSSNGSMSFLTETKAPAVVTVSELYYPGWLATIDDQPTSIFRANAIERAVLVPAGRHIVRFEYRPLSVLIGFLLGAITVLGIAIGWMMQRRHKSR